MKRENCWKPSDEDFIALATGELSSWKAPRLRRHIAVCPDCAAAFPQIMSVLQQARAERLAVAENALRERLWASLPPAPEPSRRPAPFLTRLIAVGGIGVVAAAALTLALLPGTPGRPAIAFAQVEKAMGEINTVAWTETLVAQRRAKTGVAEEKVVTEKWTQFHPLQSVSRLVRSENAKLEYQATFMLTSGEKIVGILGEGMKHYFLTKPGQDLFFQLGDTNRESLRNAAIFPRWAADAKATEDVVEERSYRRVIRRSAWESANDTIGDEKVVRFSRKVTVRIDQKLPPGFASKPTEYWMRLTVWADPETYRVARLEYDWPPPEEGLARTRLISENYRYDETPPAGTFDVPKPPLGQGFVFKDLTSEGTNSPNYPNDMFSAPDEAKMRSFCRRAVNLWNKRDADAFAALWDFSYNRTQTALLKGKPLAEAKTAAENRAPALRRYWRERVSAGKPYPTFAIREFSLTYPTERMYARASESESFPPSDGRPDSFRIPVSGLATEANGKTVVATVTFTVRRVSDGYRITFLEMPEPLQIPRLQAKWKRAPGKK